MAKVLVLRTAGVNCDEETAHAFALAGAEVTTLHIGSLLAGDQGLGDYDILAIPGGFSYGDDLGAGTVLANQLRTPGTKEFISRMDVERPTEPRRAVYRQQASFAGSPWFAHAA